MKMEADKKKTTKERNLKSRAQNINITIQIFW